MTSKECTCCHIRKPLKEFYKTKKTKSGYRNWCKVCTLKKDRISRKYSLRWQRLHRAHELIPQGKNECIDCGKVKPLSEFAIRPEFKTGYPPRCKACMRPLARKRRMSRRERYVNNVIPESKECTRCHVLKKSSCFHKDTSCSDGLCCWCRDCTTEVARKAKRQKMTKLPTTASKQCSHCKQEKPVLKFRLSKTSKSGYCRWCIDCEKAYRENHHDDSMEARKMAHRQMRYGIIRADYEAMLKSQNYVCAICGQPETRKSSVGTIRPLAVDHCHTSGKVRSLLCDGCNNGIARFHDNPNLLIRAAEYLRRFQPATESE